MIFPWYVIMALVATSALLIILLVIEIIQYFAKKSRQDTQKDRMLKQHKTIIEANRGRGKKRTHR